VLGTIAAGMGWGGSQALLARDLARTTPDKMPSSAAYEALGEAAHKRIDAISPGRKVNLQLNEAVPTSFRDALDNPDVYSGNSRNRTPGNYDIDINPNADRSYFAHELGHIASDQTDIGHLIRSARGNPKMTKALLGSLLLLPGATAALTPGDDDFAASTALALAASSPVLLDEILASKNGLAIMKDAGMRATMGQRGRLAGGLMTYLGPALLAGAAGNTVGNLLDEDPIAP
jgi:hypothetical protein